MASWLADNEQRARVSRAVGRLRALRERVAQQQASPHARGYSAERAATLVLIDEVIAASEQILAETDAPEQSRVAEVQPTATRCGAGEASAGVAASPLARLCHREVRQCGCERTIPSWSRA